MRIDDAVHQVWPAFVLVSGLLLVGVAANSDALFFRAGRLLERLPGSPSILLVAGMTLVTAVTAVLNLDTAVVFLTPVLVLAARHRGVDEEPFLFSAVFMANASSLYLPGSNLTNLLVLAHDPVSGGTFAARMFAPALTATLATAVGLLLLFHRKLNGPTGPREIAVAEPSTGVGLAAVFAAAVLTVLLANPAVPVLLVGLAAVGVQLARRALGQREVVRALGPLVLAGLFTLSVALGVLARSWDGPAQLLNSSGRWGTAAIGALASVTINNLPAAVLLSARPLSHPRSLLLGLNLGPNLAVTGSLSAYLWLKAARQVGQRPSLVAFTTRGALLAPLAIVMALAAATLLAVPR